MTIIPEYNVAYTEYSDAYASIIDRAKPLAFPRGKFAKTKERQPRRALNILCAFDIETSRIMADGTPHAVPYLWQLQLGLGSPVAVGRDFFDLREIFEELAARLPFGTKLVIYVHNLSHEFQFLTSIYDFTPEEVFAPKMRKVLKCSMFEGAIEFRCSWYLTNMSLELACKSLHPEHTKLPDYDYDTVRYPWTPLTDFELAYSITDCYCVTEIVSILLRQNDDTLMTIPMTNTGYVRRDCKSNIHAYNEYLKITALKPTYECFQLLEQAFRGGDTHANWLYTGEILENVKSADMSSAYPNTEVNDLFPMTPLEPDTNHTLKHLISCINKGKACLFEITFKQLSQKDNVHFSYIPQSKSRNVVHPLTDNGRIVSADELTITLTDIDLRIIMREYDFKAVKIHKLYTARYGKAPRALIELNREYYIKKTTLKDVPGQEELYTKSKNRLNSGYGMTAQSPLRRGILYKNHEWKPDDSETDEELFEHGNATATLPYQIGVWTTAHCRYHLHEGLWIVGDDAVYWDTDSIKYLDNEDDPYDFSPINDRMKALSTRNNATAIAPNGERHYMGPFEAEKTYSRFVTLGAKKYAFEYASAPNTCYITIAGVNKKKGGPELYAAGGLETFARCADPKHHFTFTDAGGTCSLYNDLTHPITTVIEGHELTIGANLAILPSTYTLGLGKDYERFLRENRY